MDSATARKAGFVCALPPPNTGPNSFSNLEPCQGLGEPFTPWGVSLSKNDLDTNGVFGEIGGMSLKITDETIARQSPVAQAIVRMLLAKFAELWAKIDLLEWQLKGKTPQNSSLPPSSVATSSHSRPPPLNPISRPSIRSP
jgi:hypothetical protein